MGTRSFTSHALHTLGATSESSGSPSQERLTYEELLAGPNVAKNHQVKQKPAEKFVTLLGDAKQSTKRQRQEEIRRENSQPGPSASSSCCAADTSTHVPDQQVPKSARQLSQSLGETVHFGSSKPTQSPKTNGDRSGKPVAQEIVVGVLQEEPSSSDRPGRPVSREEQHVRNHDSSGKPEREEAQHTVQENYHLKSRDTVDKFDLATDDTNVDFSVSGIPEEAVKRSENFNILQLIRRITRHPQKQAVQNDLDQEQSFNAFSAESKKAIKESGNIEISEIVNAEPKWQCKSCLNHCNPGVIYCVCGRLMTTDSAENRKYISSTLDSFSIPCFYIRKDRPRGHRYGKAPGCKEYHTAHQLAKKCRKRGYESIHDRYIRDKAFRRAMIDHSRTEQMIIEMDKLAKEDHSYKASKAEIEFYRGNWWLHSNVARVDSMPVRYEPEFKSALSTMQRLKRAEDKKKQEATAQTSSSSSSWHWHSSWWESDYEYSPQLNPAPHIHEQMTTSNYGYDIAYNFTQNNIMLEHNAMNNMNTVAHMDVHNTQY